MSKSQCQTKYGLKELIREEIVDVGRYNIKGSVYLQSLTNFRRNMSV